MNLSNGHVKYAKEVNDVYPTSSGLHVYLHDNNYQSQRSGYRRGYINASVTDSLIHCFIFLDWEKNTFYVVSFAPFIHFKQLSLIML